jgi:hypothetical protein
MAGKFYNNGKTVKGKTAKRKSKANGKTKGETLDAGH